LQRNSIAPFQQEHIGCVCSQAVVVASIDLITLGLHINSLS